MSELLGPRRFRNTEKMIALSRENWLGAEARGMIHLFARGAEEGRLQRVNTGREFINMSSYSYLGLNRHPTVVSGAISALQHEGLTGLGITPTRMQPALMHDAQEELSRLFDAECLIALSCTTATAAILPLVSSGHLIDGRPRVTVFDKRCHFCMEVMKPACAEEALVLSCPHNDMNYLEDVCKNYPQVAYIADGAYSMGGVADFEALFYLQQRYGLFLWFDDSHALSIYGDRGEGCAKARAGELNELTLVTASLEKGFGCAGGVVMLNRKQDTSFINTFGGPMCWSQSQGVANLGAILASAQIHDSPLLGELQATLRRNTALFDQLRPTDLAGGEMPVRPILLGDATRALDTSAALLEEGFYSAPVFFPITSRGKEGLRVMIRSDMQPTDIERFCNALDRYAPLSAWDAAVAPGMA